MNDSNTDLLIRVDDEAIRVHRKIIVRESKFIAAMLRFREVEAAPVNDEAAVAAVTVYKFENIGRAISFPNRKPLISAGRPPADVVDLSQFSMGVVNCCLHYMYGRDSPGGNGNITVAMLRNIGFAGWRELVLLAEHLLIDEAKFRKLLPLHWDIGTTSSWDEKVARARDLFELDQQIRLDADQYIRCNATGLLAPVVDGESSEVNDYEMANMIRACIRCTRVMTTEYLVQLLIAESTMSRRYYDKVAAGFHTYAFEKELADSVDSRVFPYIVGGRLTRNGDIDIGRIMEYLPPRYTADDVSHWMQICADYDTIPHVPQ